jgi:hypothetical protein
MVSFSCLHLLEVIMCCPFIIMSSKVFEGTMNVTNLLLQDHIIWVHVKSDLHLLKVPPYFSSLSYWTHLLLNSM